ncbi:fibronectin type III [Olleya aquimaris]|nr:fibronectin type III [Olleya aquimaris]
MYIKKSLMVLSILIAQNVHSQVLLEANEAGNTYEDINAVLAPGYDVIEAPDCNHSQFGRHIQEVFDKELNKNVFKFSIHTSPDNDRCKKYDRQRNEIKTYASSPNYLKATKGETVEYKWKFKLPKDFKVSSSFTHIHQIKSVGGPYASIPMISLTLRKGTKDKLELRYTSTNKQATIKTMVLDQIKGHWVEVTELITFSNKGSYAIELKKVLTNETVFSYENLKMDMWQEEALFSRPKWGIYRSLNNSQDLKDEVLLYASFSIQEIDLKLTAQKLLDCAIPKILMSKSTDTFLNIKSVKPKDNNAFVLFDNEANLIGEFKIDKNNIDTTGLAVGNYFMVFYKNSKVFKVIKYVIN